MKSWLSSLFHVTIDFKESHMFFPILVMWFLLLLLVLIFIIYGIPFIRALAKGERHLSFSFKEFDAFRFFGTIVLTIAYFLSMDYVSDIFPNRGLGFLFMSVPFMFCLSSLYVHDLNRDKFITLSLNASISPSLAWYILARLFHISLP